MAALELDPLFPVRVTSGSQDHHPTAVETTRGLLACVYERNDRLWRTYSLDRGLTWATAANFAAQNPIYHPRAQANFRNGFALVWGNPELERDVWFEEINEIMNISDHLMSARINRSFSSTSKGGNFTIANPDRMYDPEVPGTEWTGVFMPGARIKLNVGYGNQMKTRFDGYIDDVNSEDRSGLLEITARGGFKQLLDNNLRTKRQYVNEKRTSNIADLAIEAGMDPYKVSVESSEQVFSGTFEREKTYMEVISEHVEKLGMEMFEPDEGGLVVRTPTVSATASWFYEEDLNMYMREREWSDDDVYTSVIAYRDTIYEKDGKTVKIPGIEAEAIVDTPFFTPAKKTDFIKMGRNATQTDAENAAQARANFYSRQGSTIQVTGPLNVVLEVGDTINVRRESWNQSGLYYIEELEDDLRKNSGQSRVPAGSSRGGQFAGGQGGGGGFSFIAQARKVG